MDLSKKKRGMGFTILEEHVESFNKSPINIDILLQYNPQRFYPLYDINFHFSVET